MVKLNLWPTVAHYIDSLVFLCQYGITTDIFSKTANFESNQYESIAWYSSYNFKVHSKTAETSLEYISTLSINGTS